MGDPAGLLLNRDVPGVRPADQKRSRILLEKFAIAGREALLDTRLDDISIPALAKAAKSSVGGFYSRFESKQAFFEFLRMQMLAEHNGLYEARLAPQRFEGCGRADVSAAFVDVMLEVFGGPWRGVLREAYALIPVRPESWAPMKDRGRLLLGRIIALLTTRIDRPDGLEERVSIAVQLLFSALNNEMMNPNLAFSINDPRFRDYLVAAFDHLVAGAVDAAPEGADEVSR